MAPRPRCPICRSKKWHRDQLSGSIVCEEGHLLQGYVNESNEAQGTSQHVTTRQRLHRARRKATRAPPNSHYHGQRSIFLRWQSLQWILRQQVRVLVEELAWPVELEAVTRDLWTVLLVASGVPDAPGDWERDDEPADTFTGPRKGMGHTRKKRKKKKEDEDDDDDDADDEDEERPSDDGSVQDDDDHDGERRGAVESSETESSGDESDIDDDQVPDVAPSRPRPRRASLNAADQPTTRSSATRSGQYVYKDPRKRPNMELLLLIIYLACTTLRFPIFLKDLFDLAENHRILYINAHRYLPPTMQTHLDRDARRLLSPTNVPNISDKSIHSHLSHLVNLYRIEWNVVFPPPVLPLLVWRLCKSLACPPTFYEAVLKVLEMIQPFDIELAPRKGDDGGRRKRGCTVDGDGVEKGLTGLPESVLAALLVVVFKFSIGRKEGMGEMDRWMKTIEEMEEVKKEDGPSRLWSKEVTSLSSSEIDDYLSFFERNILADQAPPKRMQDHERFFPPPPSPPSAPAPASSSTTIHHLISKLYAEVEPLSSSPTPSAETPYHQYTLDNSSSLPYPLSSFISHLSKLVGHSDSSLMSLVGKVERVIESRQGRNSSKEHEGIDKWDLRRTLKMDAMRMREERWEIEVERRKELEKVVGKGKMKRDESSEEDEVARVIKSGEWIDSDLEQDVERELEGTNS